MSMSVLERQVAAVWKEILGPVDLGPDDSFFDVGGCSRSALSLIARMTVLLGVSIPIASFYDAPTVRAIATQIQLAFDGRIRAVVTSEGLGDSPVVRLHPGSRRASLFCVHAAGGHLMDYTALAREVASRGFAVHGIQAPGLGSDAPPVDDLVAMARTYAGAIEGASDVGLPVVVGYCAAGTIALEIARQLAAGPSGRVPLLVLIDSGAPLPGLALDLAEVAERAGSELLIDIDPAALAARSSDAWITYVWSEFQRQAPAASEQLGPRTFERLFQLHMSISAALTGYEAMPYRGPAHLLWAQERSRRREPDYDAIARSDRMHLDRWRSLLPALEWEYSPGHHISMMRPPYVSNLVDRIEARIASLCGTD